MGSAAAEDQPARSPAEGAERCGYQWTLLQELRARRALTRLARA